MSYQNLQRAVLLGTLLLLAGCGGDEGTPPTFRGSTEDVVAQYALAKVTAYMDGDVDGLLGFPEEESKRLRDAIEFRKERGVPAPADFGLYISIRKIQDVQGGTEVIYDEWISEYEEIPERYRRDERDGYSGWAESHRVRVVDGVVVADKNIDEANSELPAVLGLPLGPRRTVKELPGDPYRSRDIGVRVFRSIGCIGPWCRHPSPTGRAHAYTAGFEYQELLYPS